MFIRYACFNFMTKINYFFIIVLFTSACSNLTGSKKPINTTSDPSVLDNGATTTSGTYTHVLKNVSVATADSSSGTPSLQLKLTVDAGRAGFQPLTAFCGLGSTNPCMCEMTWTEVNNSGGNIKSYDRTKRVPVTDVQSGLVKCTITQALWDEIPSTTVIKLNIIASSSNVTGLSCKSLDYKKGTSISPSGDFTDDTLTPFLNIKRYACFTNRTTAHEITNAYTEPTVDCPSGSTCPTYQVVLGSKFCTGDTSGSAGSAAGGSSSSKKCMPPRQGPSAQSYYRNFYVRSDENVTNSRNDYYDCPLVAEAIGTNPSPAVSVNGTGTYWPYDTTFSLAKDYSADWSVGVSAASTLLRNSSDGVSTACVNEDLNKRFRGASSGAGGSPTGEPGVATKCIGYAKKPKLDGTCGTITDSNGRVRPLVRLRRYRAIFPPTFGASGRVAETNLAADEVYVADRLVVNSAGVATGAMIYGPKPCNYAWFDHEGVTTRDGTVSFSSSIPGDGVNFATPGYMATSDYQYRECRNGGCASVTPKKWSVNADGQIFPNQDHSGTITNASNYYSCSATLPIVDDGQLAMRLLTTNFARNDKITYGSRDFFLSEVHVQPIDPWTPNYVEDTSFQACAPLPTNYAEPPLHFYKKDDNTVGWCAKVYPTQNPHWIDLNKKVKPSAGGGGGVSPTTDVINYTGGIAGVPLGELVPGFTSHRNIPHTFPGGAGTYTSDLLNGLNSCQGVNQIQLCAMTASSSISSAACQAFLTNFCDHKMHSNCAVLYQKPDMKACDRTVMYDPVRPNKLFPLTATDDDINTMLSNDLNHDKGFSCQYSVNPDPTKVNAKMPSSGCCGVVGGVPLLKPILDLPGETAGTHNGPAGHLEPYRVTTSPFTTSTTGQIYYCGSPVE